MASSTSWMDILIWISTTSLELTWKFRKSIQVRLKGKLRLSIISRLIQSLSLRRSRNIPVLAIISGWWKGLVTLLMTLQLPIPAHLQIIMVSRDVLPIPRRMAPDIISWMVNMSNLLRRGNITRKRKAFCMALNSLMAIHSDQMLKISSHHSWHLQTFQMRIMRLSMPVWPMITGSKCAMSRHIMICRCQCWIHPMTMQLTHTGTEPMITSSTRSVSGVWGALSMIMEITTIIMMLKQISL